MVPSESLCGRLLGAEFDEPAAGPSAACSAILLSLPVRILCIAHLRMGARAVGRFVSLWRCPRQLCSMLVKSGDGDAAGTVGLDSSRARAQPESSVGCRPMLEAKGR